jgi:hypothetical protein
MVGRDYNPGNASTGNVSPQVLINAEIVHLKF